MLESGANRRTWCTQAARVPPVRRPTARGSLLHTWDLQEGDCWGWIWLINHGGGGGTRALVLHCSIAWEVREGERLGASVPSEVCHTLPSYQFLIPLPMRSSQPWGHHPPPSMPAITSLPENGLTAAKSVLGCAACMPHEHLYGGTVGHSLFNGPPLTIPAHI